MKPQDLVAQFAHPSAPYRPMMFWLWNGIITREGIAESMADLAAQGVGGVFLEPMGEHFRLHDFLEGVTPAYLSDEYLELVKYAVECAQEHGLYVWLYDEGGWPSGSAQGKVIEGHPEFRGQRLHARRFDPATENLPENCVAAVGWPAAGRPVALELDQVGQWAAQAQAVFVFTLEPDGYLIDVLNPAAVARFIETTHERYAAVMGEHFGKTIPGMFTDETSMGGFVGGDAIPWTQGVLAQLTAKAGTDARLLLPLLFDPEVFDGMSLSDFPEHERVAARCDAMDVLSRLFWEAYWGQLTDWCAAHNLLHTGHVGGEDNLPDHAHFGHFFRTAGRLHIPGVDCIWRQLFPEKDNFPFPRLAASAVNQRPRQAEGAWANSVITETNAVYGYGFEYGQMRWLADYQFQAGVNLYAAMARYYNTADGKLYGTMSHTGPGQPLWPHYRAFADYIGRWSVLARGSQENIEVGVYYPIEDLWAGYGESAWEGLQGVCGRLVEGQIGFDFVCAEALAEATIDNGKLQTPGAAYSAIIVVAQVMPAEALRQLARFHEAGGELIFVEQLPVYQAETSIQAVFTQALSVFLNGDTAPVPWSELEETLADLPLGVSPLKLTDPQPDLLITRRELEGATLFILTNNSAEVLEPDFAFDALSPQPQQLEAWDLRDGEVVPLLQAAGSDVLDFKPILAPWTTEAFVVRPVATGTASLDESDETKVEHDFAVWIATPADRRSPNPPKATILAEFDEATNIEIVEEYVVAHGSLNRLETPQARHPFATGPAPLLTWTEWGLGDFSGEVEYVFEFPVAAEYVDQTVLLDLGEVFWAAAVWLNGSLVADSLWPPHSFDLTGRLQAGDNRLVVRVANTLANQICRPEVVAEARERGWANAYFERCLPMMSDDRSGLIGPVQLILGGLIED